MSEQWTKGPFTVRAAKAPVDGAIDYAIGAEVDGRMQVIAEVFGRADWTVYMPAKSTANLIAAAPDLYEALKVAVAMIEDSMKGLSNEQGVFVPGVTDLELKKDGSYMLSQARAALQKARGE